MSTEAFLRQLRGQDPGQIRRPVRAASGIVGEIQRARTFKQPTRLERFRKAWASAAGEEIAANSSVASYKEGELRVVVQSQALAHELSVFRKAELVEAMNKALDKKDRIASIKFTTGRARKR